MTEQHEKLHRALADLDRELAALEQVDPDTRARLETARDEIEAALAEEDTQRLESDSLIERLREAEQEFEASHPTLSGILLRLSNALGQMGI